MSFCTLRSLVFLAVASFAALSIVQTTSAQSPFFPVDRYPYIGKFKAEHRDLWNKWYQNRLMLGTSLGPEFDMNARSNGRPTVGTAMGFRNGLIYRIGNGPRAGRLSLVYGPIKTKYFELNGAGGQLGFPVSDPYTVNGDPNAKAQLFEGGRIIFHTTTRLYEVQYFNL